MGGRGGGGGVGDGDRAELPRCEEDWLWSHVIIITYKKNPACPLFLFLRCSIRFPF